MTRRLLFSSISALGATTLAAALPLDPKKKITETSPDPALETGPPTKWMGYVKPRNLSQGYNVDGTVNQDIQSNLFVVVIRDMKSLKEIGISFGQFDAELCVFVNAVADRSQILALKKAGFKFWFEQLPMVDCGIQDGRKEKQESAAAETELQRPPKR